MTLLDKLKSYFKRGRTPTESQFGELIDAIFANNGLERIEQMQTLLQRMESLERKNESLEKRVGELEADIKAAEEIFQSQEKAGLLKRI
jgi:proteasome assembly chaperone (PAC2) family protein